MHYLDIVIGFRQSPFATLFKGRCWQGKALPQIWRALSAGWQEAGQHQDTKGSSADVETVGKECPGSEDVADQAVTEV